MPPGWSKVRVEAIAAASSHALATGPFGSSISARFFTDAGTPVIRGSNLSERLGKRLVEEGLAFLPPEKRDEFQRSIARKGDLIFTCWGTVGQVGLIDARATFPEYVVSNKQMKLTPDHARADSLFLYYLFSSPAMRRKIEDQSIGSSVPGFNLGQLKNVELLLPPLQEQREIAAILGALDDKIELNRKMNQTLEEIAQTLFRAWFVDFDPVKANLEASETGLNPDILNLFPDSLETSVIGKAPADWHVKPLPEVVEVNPTYRLKRGEEAPYLAMKNVPTDAARAEDWYLRDYTSGARFMNGDTLVARITPCLENGKTAFVDFLDEDQVGWGSTEFLVFRSKPPLPPEYSYFLARTPEFRRFAIAQMTGSSGRQRVRVGSLGHFSVVEPPQKIAELFGEFASHVMANLKQRDDESRTLADLRDTLLPKLISGEIRVPEAAEVVEDATDATIGASG